MHEPTLKSLQEIFGAPAEKTERPQETLQELITQTRALLHKLEQHMARNPVRIASSYSPFDSASLRSGTNIPRTDGTTIDGVFDGTQMIADDGAIYPVPENYASKSKLLEGDLLQLVTTSDGRTYFKQTSRVPRHVKNARLEHIEASHGFARTDDGKGYQILLAPLRFFRVNPGEQLTIEVPEAGGIWAAVVGKIESWYTSQTYAGTVPNV